MKKFLATMAAVSAVAIASPAVAQYQSGGQQYDQRRGGASADANLAARINQLQVRLQTGVQSGAITRQEAMQIRPQLRQLMQLERQYARNGIDGQERADLQRRMRDLRQRIRVADGGNQGNWDRYDREDGYGDDRYGRNDDRYGRDDDRYGRDDDRDQRYDRNNDGYDDRDRDRDGRWDDDVNGAQQPARGGIIGGLIDSVIGTGGLRVGQRVSGNLSPLPREYEGRYRDSSNTYYRTDGRQIYQIDARSQTVVRVYTMGR